MALVNTSSFTFPNDRVAVALSHGAFGSHLGVAFHTAKEGPKLIHLAFHKDLRVDDYPPKECWVACVVDVPPRASAQLVACLRGLMKKRPHIAYGFNLIAGQGAFAPNGSYKPPKGSDGFTCSTFVAELFRGMQLPLVDIKTWTADPANLEWGEEVCSMLVGRADEDHIAAVRKNNLGFRVRPDEVAAAADLPYTQRPASHPLALAKRDAAMASLHEHCPINPSSFAGEQKQIEEEEDDAGTRSCGPQLYPDLYPATVKQ